jgi:hypothetical protein
VRVLRLALAHGRRCAALGSDALLGGEARLLFRLGALARQLGGRALDAPALLGERGGAGLGLDARLRLLARRTLGPGALLREARCLNSAATAPRLAGCCPRRPSSRAPPRGARSYVASARRLLVRRAPFIAADACASDSPRARACNAASCLFFFFLNESFSCLLRCRAFRGGLRFGALAS